MASQRKTIRAQAVTTLGAVAPFSGRCKSGKYDAVAKKDLKDGPQVIVAALDESVEPIALKPRRFRRTLELTVRVFERADAGENLEELLDDHAELVENAVEADNTLNGTVELITPTGSTYDIDADSAQPTGAAVLTFDVQYDTQEGV